MVSRPHTYTERTGRPSRGLGGPGQAVGMKRNRELPGVPLRIAKNQEGEKVSSRKKKANRRYPNIVLRAHGLSVSSQFLTRVFSIRLGSGRTSRLAMFSPKFSPWTFFFFFLLPVSPRSSKLLAGRDLVHLYVLSTKHRASYIGSYVLGAYLSNKLQFQGSQHPNT